MLAGFGVVVWFLWVADGGWGLAADETAGEGAVELVPGVVRRPTVIGWKLLIDRC